MSPLALPTWYSFPSINSFLLLNHVFLLLCILCSQLLLGQLPSLLLVVVAKHHVKLKQFRKGIQRLKFHFIIIIKALALCIQLESVFNSLYIMLLLSVVLSASIASISTLHHISALLARLLQRKVDWLDHEPHPFLSLGC